jgi:uncharacterized membrane protein
LEEDLSMAKRKWTKKEIEKYRRMQGYSFYYNKEDSNFIVPKAFGTGWSINWANPISWVLTLVVIGLFVLSVRF